MGEPGGEGRLVSELNEERRERDEARNFAPDYDPGEEVLERERKFKIFLAEYANISRRDGCPKVFAALAKHFKDDPEYFGSEAEKYRGDVSGRPSRWAEESLKNAERDAGIFTRALEIHSKYRQEFNALSERQRSKLGFGAFTKKKLQESSENIEPEVLQQLEKFSVASKAEGDEIVHQWSISLWRPKSIRDEQEESMRQGKLLNEEYNKFVAKTGWKPAEIKPVNSVEKRLEGVHPTGMKIEDGEVSRLYFIPGYDDEAWPEWRAVGKVGSPEAEQFVAERKNELDQYYQELAKFKSKREDELQQMKAKARGN